MSYRNITGHITGKGSYLGGVFPPLMTILSLLALGGSIAMVPLALPMISASLANFVPIFVASFLSIVGLAMVNFWFSREIMTSFKLGSTEIIEGETWGPKQNYDMHKMVRQLSCELLAFEQLSRLTPKERQALKRKDGSFDFSKKEQAAYLNKTLRMPRLCTFRNDHFKIEVAEGRNPGKSALFFATGTFNDHHAPLSQKEMKALVMFQLAKIWQRKGISRIVTGIGSDFARTLENLKNGNMFSRALWCVLIPCRIFTFWEKALNRAAAFDATRWVTQCGRGDDLISALYKLNLSTKSKAKDTPKDPKTQRRTPYNGRFKFLIKPIADWIDKEELVGDDKSGSRIVSLLDILVRIGGDTLRELNSDAPKNWRLKGFVQELKKKKDKKTEKDVFNLKHIVLPKKMVYTPKLKHLPKKRTKALDRKAKITFAQELYQLLKQKGHPDSAKVISNHYLFPKKNKSVKTVKQKP